MKRTKAWPPFVFPISVIGPEQVPGSLEILRRPYAFSQTSLISAREFSKRAKERGVSIEMEQLELLHRLRVLVPLLQIHRNRVSDPTDLDRKSTRLNSSHTDISRMPSSA